MGPLGVRGRGGAGGDRHRLPARVQQRAPPAETGPAAHVRHRLDGPQVRRPPAAPASRSRRTPTTARRRRRSTAPAPAPARCRSTRATATTATTASTPATASRPSSCSRPPTRTTAAATTATSRRQARRRPRWPRHMHAHMHVCGRTASRGDGCGTKTKNGDSAHCVASSKENKYLLRANTGEGEGAFWNGNPKQRLSLALSATLSLRRPRWQAVVPFCGSVHVCSLRLSGLLRCIYSQCVALRPPA